MPVQRDAFAEWTKSSYSAVNGDCVEVKTQKSRTLSVRDSKNPELGILDFAPETWSAFVLDISRP
ncbi:DUF397 domain-containing protein [Streptomyces sp. CBMA152]|uniref:DUF397 domain-containing protein n=1 Tax=Streptomyces sp. CBMA152 TaxID=1896312 RepID=UPI001660B237|nr:DUF397 domain-containing protein [Streptomyces sp. CBMA152]MBD0746407.1 hypothetical protein [Streptomyces sp. CBMA152]